MSSTEIKHPFHPQHTLTLTNLPVIVSCDACGREIDDFPIYHCSECGFNLHVHCAALLPTKGGTEQQRYHQQYSGAESHTLMLCDYSKNNNDFGFSCSCCNLPIVKGGPIFVCLECKILMDESCANLSFEIEHPFHPEHPLSLVDVRDCRGQYAQSCNACERKCQGFVYGCLKCYFFLHLQCSLLVPLFINSKRHEHPLAFFDTKDETLRCSHCHKCCTYPFFRCLICRFNFHAHCLSDLPPSVKHKCHLHTLDLTHSPIKDYEGEGDDSKFLCDACEEERKLYEPTYYCVGCHFISHVHCVISEILPYLQRESPLIDKYGKMKLDLAIDVHKDNAKLELETDTGEVDVEILLETSVGAGSGDHDQVTSRDDESSRLVAIEELENEIKVGDPVPDELDAEIAIVQTRVDELNAQEETLKRQLESLTKQLETVAKQLETETKKSDKLEERRDPEQCPSKTL